MKSKAVRLYIRARRFDGSRPYLKPVFAASGRLRPHFAIVDGQPQHCLRAIYSLRYASDGKRVWEDVGADAQLALLAKERKQRAMDAQAAGVLLSEAERKPKTPLTEAIADYLDDTRLTKSVKTAEAYGETLRTFAESVARKHLEDLDRKAAGVGGLFASGGVVTNADGNLSNILKGGSLSLSANPSPLGGFQVSHNRSGTVWAQTQH